MRAITTLNKGGIVIYPTDTAFGIGCRIDRPDAIKRLFQIRRRSVTQATPVLVSSISMAEEYLLSIPDLVREKLLARYWPGALTVVLPCKTDNVPELVRGGMGTLGVRMPNHPIALKMIQQVGVPILGPSANFHGEKTPYSFEALDPGLVQLVDYVLSGECAVKQASTVIDCSVNPWKTLRQGEILLQKNILAIDTSDNKQITVSLEIDGKVHKKQQALDARRAQVVLPLIEELLRKYSLTLQDLTEITVHPGPGSFTGLRVGITIANTLAFLLKIPINGKKIGEYVEPCYT